MKRNFRLRRSIDFKRVRRSGKSYAHPLIVLVVLPGSDEITRYGIIAGRSLGNAVQRNRAKRILREALRYFQPRIKPGWNVILITRKGILQAKYIDVQDCLSKVFTKADLLNESNGS